MNSTSCDLSHKNVDKNVEFFAIPKLLLLLLLLVMNTAWCRAKWPCKVACFQCGRAMYLVLLLYLVLFVLLLYLDVVVYSPATGIPCWLWVAAKHLQKCSSCSGAGPPARSLSSGTMGYCQPQHEAAGRVEHSISAAQRWTVLP